MRVYDEGDEVIIYHRDHRQLSLALPQSTNRNYLVGRYMFEVDGVHYQWSEQCKNLDEVWVPSKFMVNVFEKMGVPSSKLVVVPESIGI
jgi:hypothetical protein